MKFTADFVHQARKQLVKFFAALEDFEKAHEVAKTIDDKIIQVDALISLA